MPGIPPTPIELAITPLDTEIIAAIQEPTKPQINGKPYFKFTPNKAGSVTPKYQEIQAGTLICFARSFLRCKKIIANTAEPWAILESATIGHKIVPLN